MGKRKRANRKRTRKRKGEGEREMERANTEEKEKGKRREHKRERERERGRKNSDKRRKKGNMEGNRTGKGNGRLAQLFCVNPACLDTARPCLHAVCLDLVRLDPVCLILPCLGTTGGSRQEGERKKELQQERGRKHRTKGKGNREEKCTRQGVLKGEEAGKGQGRWTGKGTGTRKGNNSRKITEKWEHEENELENVK
jgi:hypothetical protein